jgi:paraquat-inducible protein B
MNSAPKPKVSRSPALSLIWVVPVAALAIASWLIYREVRDRGPEITIEFADSSGIEANRTPLEHKGVTVGTVTRVELKEDFNRVRVHLRLTQAAAGLAREGTRFWIVHPEIGLSGVRGLETLVSGVRINVKPGSGAPTLNFTGLEHTPPAEDEQMGKAFLLQTDRLGALNPGAPVYYREVKVGSVETSRLADDSASVLVRIRVYTPYVDLVRTNTQFWNAGGVSLKFGLLGAQIKSTSLESLVVGGVSFATPDPEKDKLGPIAPEGTLFKLSSDVEKEWLKWQPKIPINPPESSPETTQKESPVQGLLKL